MGRTRKGQLNSDEVLSLTFKQQLLSIPLQLLSQRYQCLFLCVGYSVTSQWPVQPKPSRCCLCFACFCECMGTHCWGCGGQKGQWDWCRDWSCCTRGTCSSWIHRLRTRHHRWGADPNNMVSGGSWEIWRFRKFGLWPSMLLYSVWDLYKTWPDQIPEW